MQLQFNRGQLSWDTLSALCEISAVIRSRSSSSISELEGCSSFVKLFLPKFIMATNKKEQDQNEIRLQSFPSHRS